MEIYRELKKAIIDWLYENPNAWQRTNACVDAFRRYIYDENGNHIIGGEAVYNFIKEAARLI